MMNSSWGNKFTMKEEKLTLCAGLWESNTTSTLSPLLSTVRKPLLWNNDPFSVFPSKNNDCISDTWQAPLADDKTEHDLLSSFPRQSGAQCAKCWLLVMPRTPLRTQTPGRHRDEGGNEKCFSVKGTSEKKHYGLE